MAQKEPPLCGFGRPTHSVRILLGLTGSKCNAGLSMQCLARSCRSCGLQSATWSWRITLVAKRNMGTVDDFFFPMVQVYGSSFFCWNIVNSDCSQGTAAYVVHTVLGFIWWEPSVTWWSVLSIDFVDQDPYTVGVSTREWFQKGPIKLKEQVQEWGGVNKLLTDDLTCQHVCVKFSEGVVNV